MAQDNQDKAREELQAQKSALVKARRAATDQASKAAATEAIDRLDRAISDINIAVASQLGAKVDALVADLDEIRTRHSLDAVSALGRSVQKLRRLKDTVDGHG